MIAFILVKFREMKIFSFLLTHDFLAFLIVPLMIFFVSFLLKRKEKLLKWIKIVLIIFIGQFFFSILFLYINGYIRYRNFEVYLVIYISAFALGMIYRIYKEVIKEREDRLEQEGEK
ncbi:MAG: hypothetical protein RI945_395 [Candidatus Parcubacteria bacterium]